MSYALPPEGFDDMTDEEVEADGRTAPAGKPLPQPGERHNTSSIPVSDLALVVLLSLARQAMVLVACQVEDCENCNEHRVIWWDCCNALDRSARCTLQSWLIAEGWGLPPAPWEDIDVYGNPTTPPVAEPRA